ncbi:hypothetical protein [Cyclobacterium xiamenense]|uniref:hypothetical protein n=1 Tax=Cyclobacterium xiamenense TaxID=1297121 RepID=UPI0012B7EF71|nr:hypothetical protein [Cyclobacterium xiamenense]
MEARKTTISLAGSINQHQSYSIEVTLRLIRNTWPFAKEGEIKDSMVIYRSWKGRIENEPLDGIGMMERGSWAFG